jgi:fructokinase
MSFGGIEAGGTKWVCAVGSDPDNVEAVTTFPTEGPAATVGAAAAFFRKHPDISALGVGTFGPVDLEECSPRYGTITTTPKPGWTNTPLLSMLSERFGVPVAIDTDVNAAALAEHRWGAARGLDNFCYITVGTGIGGGAIVRNRSLRGLLHPEFGHMRVPHDSARDPFPGSCPFHGDCLEGLASGGAMRSRRPDADTWDAEMVELEAEYLALGVINVITVLSPQRVILGGGVMHEPGLIEAVRARVSQLAAGYFDSIELRAGIDEYIVSPELGDRAGVLGALELARLAAVSGP